MLPTGTNGVDFRSANSRSYWAPRLNVEYLSPRADVHSDNVAASATRLDIASGLVTAFLSLENAGDRDVFHVMLASAATLSIELGSVGSGNVVDAFLGLYDANGTLIAADNDSGPDEDSRLQIALDADSYFISAGSLNDTGVGDLLLSLELL
ncbi:MAG: hypothetical protein CMJ78_20920 [Planctomycetaceae bacterium]|nr:hypothetical protein [Planctomycetaceae bacterium]